MLEFPSKFLIVQDKQIKFDGILRHYMPEHNFSPISGVLERFTIKTDTLQNRLGDPMEREVLVHIPRQGFDAMIREEKLPVIVYLAPYTSSGLGRASWKAFSETLPQRFERICSQGGKPAILVLVDSFTSLGGNQFVDSPIMGNWATWLSNDLQTEISNRYPVDGTWKLIGKSSGGYGALMLPMFYPDKWTDIACHSGDCGFDLMFKPLLAEALTRISKSGSIDEFLNDFKQSKKIAGDDFHTLMIIAMAASYSPSEPSKTSELGIQLPINSESAEIDDSLWNEWLKFDPLENVEELFHAYTKLNSVYIDVGVWDQYHIQYGLRRLNKMLVDKGIESNTMYQYEEFEGSHSGIESRLDHSLRLE